MGSAPLNRRLRKQVSKTVVGSEFEAAVPEAERLRDRGAPGAVKTVRIKYFNSFA